MSPDAGRPDFQTSIHQTLNAVLTKAWPYDGESETARKRELRDRVNASAEECVADIVEVREGATLKVPLDGSALALERLDPCVEKISRVLPSIGSPERDLRAWANA